MPLRVGVSFDGFITTGEAIDLAQRAVAAGARSLWVAEHLGYREAITTCAAFALAAPGPTLVPTAVSPYLWHATPTAMALATLDELAPGRVAVALARAWRGAHSLDQSLHGVFGAGRDRRRAQAASRGMPPCRHRLACAPGLSGRAVAQHHCQRRLRCDRPPWPCLHRARRFLPPCRSGGRGIVAAAARAGVDPRARSCARSRRCVTRRLPGLRFDHRSASQDPDGGRTRPPGCDTPSARGCIRSARRGSTSDRW